MKIGIVIGTNEPEVVLNAFRFGDTSLKANHEIQIFLINKGVEIEEIKDEKYNLKEQVDLLEFFGLIPHSLLCSKNSN